MVEKSPISAKRSNSLKLTRFMDSLFICISDRHPCTSHVFDYVVLFQVQCIIHQYFLIRCFVHCFRCLCAVLGNKFRINIFVFLSFLNSRMIAEYHECSNRDQIPSYDVHLYSQLRALTSDYRWLLSINKSNQILFFFFFFIEAHTMTMTTKCKTKTTNSICFHL